jgi:LacI family transcriptional regulator
MKDRITMAQVARRAGVHPSTVSLALSNHPSIPPATRERIRALAAEMGYQPDPALRALTIYRHAHMPRPDAPPLAYLTHWDTEWGWKQQRAHARFYVGATTKAHELGYKLEHFWLGDSGLSHRRMSDIFSARGISGLIVASHLPENGRPLHLDWTKFSAVKIDYFPQEPVLHNVTNDQRAIMRMAVQRILAAGYHRIGLVMPRWWDEFGDLAWSAGFLAEQQWLPKKDQIPILYFAEGSAVRGETLVPAKPFADWIQRYQPEVLLSLSRFVGPRLKELGLLVPRDIAFVEFYHESEGGVAGVRHNCERVGALAVETLVGQMQQHTVGVPELPITSLVEGTWVEGDTLPWRATTHAVPSADQPKGGNT